MMAQKALLFGDARVARDVIAVDGTGSGAMAQVKALGREVVGFDEEIWKREREKIVLEGNLHKFRANPELKQRLLDTGERVFVEASPGDRIWGIGYAENRALEDRSGWGSNLLGKVLGQTRRMLREEEALNTKKAREEESTPSVM
ncbi:hypothetical protein BDZ94DRAFT_1274581 [Collybia nuda]|uniref:NADAR domain-containing protein n=1 Tax=Collybia nuda TaxID=64659 RepID=A0A9P5XUK9_9AGAR|nr:hypothetical protein BDZ94DRAFT_1274581 [Collybia nuda]